MIAAKLLLTEIVNSLRNVIAPAIHEPYPRAQAYMAALILEFVSRQVEERADIEEQRTAILNALFRDLPHLGNLSAADTGEEDGEMRLCQLIEGLYAERDRLGEQIFYTVNQRVRQALRQMLDQELKVAKPAE